MRVEVAEEGQCGGYRVAGERVLEGERYVSSNAARSLFRRAASKL